MSEPVPEPTPVGSPLRVSKRDVVSGEITLEARGDFTVVNVQQRGDYTYVVLKPDPTGEAYQREQARKLEEINEQEVDPGNSDQPVWPSPSPAAGGDVDPGAAAGGAPATDPVTDPVPVEAGPADEEDEEVDGPQ